MPLATQVVSRTLPNSPGWYWYRLSPESPWQPTEVVDNDGLAAKVLTQEGNKNRYDFTFFPLYSLDGEWGDEISLPKRALSAKAVTTTRIGSHSPQNGEPRQRRHFKPDPNQKIDPDKLAKFFYWMNERHQMQHLRMAGAPKPWTKDVTLRDNFFCNVFRELDKNTTWFREFVRNPLQRNPAVVLATVIFRWFNHVPTAISLLTGSNTETDWKLGDQVPDAKTATRWLKGSLFTNWDGKRAYELLKDHKQCFTGAHVVASGVGSNKLNSVITCIDNVAQGLDVEDIGIRKMQAAWGYLQSFPAIGRFLAYEIVCDLRFTNAISHDDSLQWANAGPGAMRGLNRLFGRPMYFQKESYNWLSEMKQLFNLCQPELKKGGALESLIKPLPFYPGAKPAVPLFELREVESSLCEFDKYMRVAYPIAEEDYEPGANPKQSKRKYKGV